MDAILDDGRELSLDTYDPFGAKALSSPHEGWALLRQNAPVRKVKVPGIELPVFLVTRKREIQFVVEHPEIFPSSDPLLASVFRWGNFEPELQASFQRAGLCPVHTLVTADPPDAKRFRQVVEGFLHKRNVDRLEPTIAAIVEKLVADMPEDEPFNFVDAFSMPLPLEVICLILGLPYSDAAYLRRYTDEFTHLVDPCHSRERALEAIDTVVPGYRYLADTILALRESPQDNLMSAYANARHPNGELFNFDEAVSMAHVTVIGGNETTRNGLSTAALILAQRNDLWERLDRQRELIPEFVEEIVRLGSPSAAMPRAVVEDIELAGTHLAKGSCVFLLFGSGSRDETVFDRPDQIDLERPNKRAHTSFGMGLHHCAGSILARREMVLAIRHWLEAFDSFELAVPADEVEYLPAFAFRALAYLPIKIRRRSGR